MTPVERRELKTLLLTACRQQEEINVIHKRWNQINVGFKSMGLCTQEDYILVHSATLEDIDWFRKEFGDSHVLAEHCWEDYAHFNTEFDVGIRVQIDYDVRNRLPGARG